LPYSNREWAVPGQSESVLSRKLGVQETYGRLGGVTMEVQTDQISTAALQLKREKNSLRIAGLCWDAGPVCRSGADNSTGRSPI